MKLNPPGWLRSSWPLLSLLLLVGGVALVFGLVGGTFTQPLVLALINVVLVVGLYTFVGNSGVMSFGHVSFMAVGAYACGILTIPMIARAVMIPNVPQFVRDIELNTPLGVLVGGVLAAILGVLIGIPLVRLSGLAAGLAMFAVLLIMNVVLRAWEPGVSGGGTLSRVPTDMNVPGALLALAAVLVISYLFQRSRWGLRLRASREDEQAARSLGVGVMRERLIAFTISAFIMGIGGGLFSHYVGSFTPDSFFITTTILTLAMLVIGGINSLAGAIIGSLIISSIAYVLDRWTNGQPVGPITLTLPPGTSQLTVAALMLLVLFFRPEGLTGGREFMLRIFDRNRRSRSAETVDADVVERRTSPTITPDRSNP